MKEITLPVSVLKEALPGLNKVIGRRASLPVLQSIRVMRDEDGKCLMQATDLDSFVTYTAKGAVPGPVVDMLVPMDQLSKAVKTLKSEDTIGLVVEGKDKVKLRYSIGGSMVERVINSLSVEEFPPSPQIKQPSVVLEPGFSLALRQALNCCSEDCSRRVLQGACLDVSDQRFHYVVATNGRSLFSANSFAFDLKKSVIIPDSKFLEWGDFMDKDPAALSMEPGEEAVAAKKGKPGKQARPGWVKLESGRWTFVTREIEGDFPNWRQVVPQTDEKWTKISLSEQAIKQLLLVIPSLPGDDGINHALRLRVDRYLHIEGQNKDDHTWTSIPIQEVNVSGNPVTIGLNREYLLNGLRFGLNQMEIEDKLSPVVLSKGGKKMVIMPVNLDGPTPAPNANPPTPETPPVAQQSAPQPTAEAPAQERTGMPGSTKTSTAPESITRETRPVGAQTNSNNGNGTQPAIKSLVDQVESIKDGLKGIIRDLSGLADTVKQAEKEKKATEREIEAVRCKLRQIQNVNI